MKDTNKMKKEFQKVIGAIRKGQEQKSDYPKPMMTGQQMEKNTATVNCGGEWSIPEKTRAKAEMVMADERFKAFLEKWEATARFEIIGEGNTQIRINY